MLNTEDFENSESTEETRVKMDEIRYFKMCDTSWVGIILISFLYTKFLRLCVLNSVVLRALCV